MIAQTPSRDVPAGTVYLVGAGPGAPDLLTLRAARLIEQADILFHDALVHPEVIALASRAEKVAVGKRCGRHATAQHFINRRLVAAARTHRTVVRLKGGDPLLFGRAQEEIAALEEAGIPFAVVPGVTAALAACADLRTSLTQRGIARSVAFVTPRVGAEENATDWQRALAQADAGAIYMGAGQTAAVAAALLAAGKAAGTPVAIVENASLPNMQARYTTVGGLAACTAASAGPALILVGAQFRHRGSLAESDATADRAPAQHHHRARG